MSQGKHTLLAFLDCSKYYEIAGHNLAGDRAINTRLQARVANMVFDMYKRDRHVKPHGTLAQPRTGNHGLVASCAFAKDTHKACTATLKNNCAEGRPRDYVDDIALCEEGDTAIECAAKMHAEFEQPKSALRRDNVALNDGKQQVLGFTKEV